MRSADVIVARARACVGARFRLHGRDPEAGLDCVGVAAVAYALGRVPAGYALRGGRAEWIVAEALALGFAAAVIPQAGDLLLIAAGPFQHHLAVSTGNGFVHADARLRRVVETPGVPGGPVIARLSYRGN